MTHYIASGSVRGDCGHKHRSADTAQRCVDADQNGVRSAYPSTYPTRAYSDREVIRVDDDGSRHDVRAEDDDAEMDAEYDRMEYQRRQRLISRGMVAWAAVT